MESEDPVDLRSLVDRAREGDVGAFRELFERYHERVHRYARARLGRSDEAQDAVQDVFLAVWRGLPAFRYDHVVSFPAWLFGIARNVAATYARRSRRVLPLPQAFFPDHPVEFEGLVLTRRVLAEELSRLPDVQREVVMLRFLVGLSTREAAAAVGRSEGAAMALQMRGLERLRRRIGPGR